jgi:methylated-DNA-[protein]-cysteine S-methyltransferase
MGWVAVLVSDKGLVAATLPCPSDRGAIWLLGRRVRSAERDDELKPALVKRLESYFLGSREQFPDKLDLSGATPFQRDVWQATREIPYGETRSYRWIAVKIGKPGAVRAVGQALGRNPLPVIVPCHRVVAADGSIGGFTGGIWMKRRLLGLEMKTVYYL